MSRHKNMIPLRPARVKTDVLRKTAPVCHDGLLAMTLSSRA